MQQGRWKVEKDGQAKKEEENRALWRAAKIHIINIHELFTLTLWEKPGLRLKASRVSLQDQRCQ